MEALAEGKYGCMVSLRGPDIAIVPIIDAIKDLKKVQPDSDIVRAARAVGISFGDN